MEPEVNNNDNNSGNRIYTYIDRNQSDSITQRDPPLIFLTYVY